MMLSFFSRYNANDIIILGIHQNSDTEMYKHTSDAAANRKMNIYIYPILRYHANDNIILAFRAYGSPG